MKNILSNLSPIVRFRKKRLGRGLGSGKGSKSTRGTTRHQKAREAIPIHFEGGQGRMVKKYPLLRGKGRNKPSQKKSLIVNIDELNIFKDGDTVTIKSLMEKKIIEVENEKVRVKLLSNGTLEKKLNVQLPLSQSAKKIIEKLGGKVIV